MEDGVGDEGGPRAADRDEAVEVLSPAEAAPTLDEVLADVDARRRALDAMPDGPRPSGGPYKRRRLMVDLPLQLTYVSVYLLTTSLLLVGFVALNYVFAAIYQRASLLQQELGPAAAGGSPNLALLLLVNFVFVMLLLIGASVYAVVHSHRVAGPAFRLRRALDQLLARDYDHWVQLRRKDFLHELAEQLNQLNAQLKAKDVVIADAVARLGALRPGLAPAQALALEEVVADLADVVLAAPAAAAAEEPGAPGA